MLYLYRITLLTLVLASIPAFAQSRPEAILVDEIGASGSRKIQRQRLAGPRPKSSTSTAYRVERATFDLMNAERTAKGLPLLKWNDQIADLARLHSLNMAEHKFFSHRGVDGTMVDDRADMLGIGGWRAIGENIAYMRGYDNPDQMAVEKWLNSTSHRRNMLSPTWRESAIGVAVTPDGTYYFTQVFILRN